MKNLHALVLALVSLAALAGFSAGPASATVLCSTETSPCTGSKYGLETEVKAKLKTGTEWTLTSAGLGTVKCKKSEITGEIQEAGSSTSTPLWRVFSFITSECTCPVATLWHGSFEPHYTGAGDGSFVGKTQEFTISCAGLSCVFGTDATSGTSLGTIAGGSPAVIAINAQVPHRTLAKHGSAFVCTTKNGVGTFGFATLNATYEVTTPAPLYLAAS